MMLSRVSVLFVLGMGAVFVMAQNPTDFTSIPLSSSSSHSRWMVLNERHFQPTSVGALFLDSAFAHGYRHGYEQGFHLGDLDLHMGRAAQVMKKRDFRNAKREYSNSFGSKEAFQRGYEAGLPTGYDDAFRGREYRATERAKLAAAGLSDALPPSRRQYFDEGFAGGYASARLDSIPAKGMSLDYVEQYCQEKLLGSHPAEYCSGFGRGFVFAASAQSGTESTATARASR
jgi:hypothetical protein